MPKKEILCCKIPQFLQLMPVNKNFSHLEGETLFVQLEFAECSFLGKWIISKAGRVTVLFQFLFLGDLFYLYHPWTYFIDLCSIISASPLSCIIWLQTGHHLFLYCSFICEVEHPFGKLETIHFVEILLYSLIIHYIYAMLEFISQGLYFIVYTSWSWSIISVCKEGIFLCWSVGYYLEFISTHLEHTALLMHSFDPITSPLSHLDTSWCCNSISGVEAPEW